MGTKRLWQYKAEYLHINMSRLVQLIFKPLWQTLVDVMEGNWHWLISFYPSDGLLTTGCVRGQCYITPTGGDAQDVMVCLFPVSVTQWMSWMWFMQQGLLKTFYMSCLGLSVWSDKKLQLTVAQEIRFTPLTAASPDVFFFFLHGILKTQKALPGLLHIQKLFIAFPEGEL